MISFSSSDRTSIPVHYELTGQPVAKKPELVPDVSFYAACNAPGSRPVSWRRASTLKSLWMRATAVQDSKISRKLKGLQAGGEIPDAVVFANIGSCLDAPPLGIMAKQAN